MSTAAGFDLSPESSSPTASFLPNEEPAPTFAFSDAFRRVYAAQFARVWRGLLRLGVSRELLEDAAQDVFLVVHRREQDFAGRSSLDTWIYGIVLRVAKDYRRTSLRHRRRVERLAAFAPPEPEANETPAVAAERNEAARLVQAALGRLPDTERELFVLVELEELPTQTAATLLGFQLRTCQRRLERAREHFERALTALLEEPRLPEAPANEPTTKRQKATR